MDTKSFKVNTENSTIDWIGRKVTGAHNGTIGIKDGNFRFEDGKSLSGKFTIDTRTIKILDIEDPETNAQFASHLTSDDFFNAEHFPEAFFEITHAEPGGQDLYYVKGDLTIKGITQPFDTSFHIVATERAAVLDTKIVVDRTKFNIKFRSSNFFTNLGDTLIYNNFDLNIHLVADAY
ncbi:YceI family protein [Chryseobacterium sp. Tr-659]|uniref:YceI family protein n=1 Tax=Chryseobacterium sp. Tr-659 TaxID=2608340 RepID=UPI001423F1B9|nr:YceI family protein [Chryseobacterium sp. Tr-659]NIF04746.1 YceI family protein [Chryseobacterium sp. Tr-659]